MTTTYDVAVVGGGPAGATAAIFLGRAKLATALIDADQGMTRRAQLHNVLGFVDGITGPELQLLPYSASLPEGKSTTLLGGVAMQYWLGNYGADRVAIIDPSAAEPFRLVDLPSRRVHFAIFHGKSQNL